MMRIHLQGIPGAGVAGTYIRSVAEEKLDLIQARNDSTGHSLMATMQLAE
jgi:ATP-dependent Clp protease adapter protein ClpS